MSSSFPPRPVLTWIAIAAWTSLAPLLAVEWRFHFPLVDDYRVLAVQQCFNQGCDAVPACRRVEIYGDGHLEVAPPLAGVPPRALALSDADLETLLRSLEPLLLDGVDLRAEASALSNDAPVDRVELRLDGIVGRTGLDERRPVHVVRSGDVPPVVFEEVKRLTAWLHRAYVEEHGVLIWGGFKIGGPICSTANRAAQGLGVAEPPWCEGFPQAPDFRDAGPFDGDAAKRDEIREKLRERLRRLPRGLQKQDDGEASCGSKETDGMDLGF